MTAVALPAKAERVLEDPIEVLGDGGVGFVGTDVPIEVLLATQRPFGHLPWNVSEPTPFSDRFLESSFPFWARSILQQWHDGRFDAVRTVVFSRADDASQRLYYYVVELQQRGLLRGPEAVMFDIAQVVRESSLVHTAASILKLCAKLDVSAEGFGDAFDAANALREKLMSITARRKGDGPVFERIARAALWCDPSQWIDELDIANQKSTAAPVLLVGSMPPDDRIHCAVEGLNASIVAEMHAHSLDRLGPLVNLDGGGHDRALAKHLQTASMSPRAWFNRADRIAERACALEAAAAIIWLTKEDEALAWQVPKMKSALAERGIPTVLLPAGDWRFDAGQQEQLQRFFEAESIDAAP